MNEYIILHKIIYIFYNLRINMCFDYLVNKSQNICDIVFNSNSILNENTTNFDIIIDILAHKQNLNNENIKNIYENIIDLLNEINEELSINYIYKLNILFYDIFNYNYTKKIKNKYIIFYEKYKIPNCIKIINKTGYDINILYSFDYGFNIKKKYIYIKNNITDLSDLIILNKTNNVKKYITPIIKNNSHYYINLYDNEIILLSVLYKQKSYNININKIKKYIKGVLCSNIIIVNNYNRIIITDENLLNNNYLIK